MNFCDDKMTKEYICEKGKHSRVVLEIPPQEIAPDATVLIGFAGVGLIGPITTYEVVDKIEDMKQIGFVASDSFPPISIFTEGILKHPCRLYYSKSKNLIVLACDIPFQSPNDYNDLARTVLNFCLKVIHSKEMVIIQGILVQDIVEEFKVFYAAEKEIMGKLEKLGIEKLSRGIIVGPEATIINEALNNQIDAYVLFTDAYQIPTPDGAAAIIKALNKIYDLDIDLTNLLERGKEIKEKLMELSQKAQQMHLPEQAMGPDDKFSKMFM